MSSPSEQFNAALQHHQAGQLVEAERLYEAILLQQPNQAHVLYLLGLANHQRGQLDAAVQWYRRAIAIQPNYADAHNNLGVLFVQQGNFRQATIHYQAALEHNPTNASAHANLGVVLQNLQQFEAAIVHYQTAIRLDPNLAVAHTNLGHAFKETGDLVQAIVHYQTARQLMPTNPDAYRDLGDALQEQGQFQQALEVYDRALVFAPNNTELKGSRIRTLLISGNLHEGFAEYDDWRLALSSQRRSLPQPQWDGSHLHGQFILLYVETGAGFGDAIQFIRYAPLVANRGGRVIVECSSALVRLVQTMPAIAQVITPDEPLPEVAVQASLLSLPRILETTLQTIPHDVPYLHWENTEYDRLPEGPNSQPRLRVGLVWGGDVNHYTDRDRSCPFQELQPILDLPCLQFYSLQKGHHQAELTDARVIDLSDRLIDFAATAAIIQQLDLVITVDTAVAHLTGALGKPIWILLAYAADWRWLMQREDSPWYPTARLFRQPRRRDWRSVCQQVAIALSEMVKGEDETL